MLSYQHAYHAGNAADVHKHVALVMVLRHLAAKEKPFSFIDTHAGRGLYDLESPEAHRTREAEGGVLRLAAAEGLAEPVRDYLTIVAGHNRRGAIRFYPGSAAIARALRQFVASDPRFSLHVRDCYEALPGLLPPTIRRGLVLIDPSYEVKSEYEDIVRLLDRALRRWANGIYLLWYPLLPGRRDRLLLRQLAKLAPPKVLVSEYSFSASSDRLQGSGLIVVNPPWQFENELTAAMQSVVDALGIGTHSVRAQPL
jgi:23S rRNA (adenine2030-N6)-methyltransferase